MDKTRKRAILLGLFVIIGIVIFIFGIFQVGSKNELFKKTFLISAKFSNTTGLKAGSNVRFNGVKVGIVKSVSLLNDTTVRVEMSVEESKRSYILKNAIASIASDGLMGDKIVNIAPGDGRAAAVENNDEILGHNPLVTDKVLATLNATNENIRVISGNLKMLTTDLNAEHGTIQELIKDPQMAGDLRSSFSNLHIVTNKVLDVSSSLQQITSQVRAGQGTAGKILSDSTLGLNLAHAIEKLKETSDELDNVSGQLSATMHNVNSGKGTVNMLLTDTAFSGNIQQSILNIRSASKKLDQNMEALKHNFLLRRYFKKQAKKNAVQAIP